MKLKKIGILAAMVCLIAANAMGCSKKTNNTYESLVMAQQKTRQLTGGEIHVSLNITPKNGTLEGLETDRNTEIDFSYENEGKGLLYTYNAVDTYQGTTSTMAYERKQDGLYDMMSDTKYELDGSTTPNHLESVLSYFSFEYKENEIEKSSVEEKDGYKVYTIIPKKTGAFDTECKYWIKNESVLKVERTMTEEFDVNGKKDTITTVYSGEITPK